MSGPNYAGPEGVPGVAGISDDQLQNELLLISHHLGDMEEGLHEKDLNYVQKGIDDIKEIVERLNGMLPSKLQSELERTNTDEGGDSDDGDVLDSEGTDEVQSIADELEV